MEEITQKPQLNDQNVDSEATKNPQHPVKLQKSTKNLPSREPLLTKTAVEFLLSGTLSRKVCKYCLNVASELSELDQILQVAGQGTLYKVCLKDMIAAFHPFEIAKDNLPNKICNKCLDRTIAAYLFTQQCERSERAIQNCFEEICEKFDKLDPLNPQRKQGRKKLIVNHNVIQVSHAKVIDYAEPVIHLVNRGSAMLNDPQGTAISKLECPKCWQTLPDLPALVKHEKTHPKSMWFHCRLCGNSFAKLFHWRRHMKSHDYQNSDQNDHEDNNKRFHCKECDTDNDNYMLHLQHVDKHKFKKVLKQVLIKKTDDLCTVCLENGQNMLALHEMVEFHAGYPELSGGRTLHNILGSTVPDANFHQQYIGTKICGKCKDRAIDAFIFINQSLHNRRRLATCVSAMVDSLDKTVFESDKSIFESDKSVLESNKSIFIEIADRLILPVNDVEIFDEALSDDDIDESQLKVDVLEDEFRVKSSSESEDEKHSEKNDHKNQIDDIDSLKSNLLDDLFKDTPVNNVDDADSINAFNLLDNPAKKATKTYVKKKVYNGFKTQEESKSIDDVCSEFLTFKRKPNKPAVKVMKSKFKCPMCSKHFITAYFLSKHVLKHVDKKVTCSVCDCAFKSKFFLYEHTKIAHLSEYISYDTCEMCGRIFTDNSKLIKHQRTHFKTQCYICDKIFLSQKYYNSHLQRHVLKFNTSNRKMIQNCSFCEKECPNKNELTRHVNKDHLQIKPFSCEMCDRKFYTRMNLLCHKKVHDIFSIEKCEFCDKILKSRRVLVEHVREHIGLKPHVCLMCKEAFYSERCRNKHMRKRHGGRLICQLCNSGFTSKNNLKLHAETHMTVF